MSLETITEGKCVEKVKIFSRKSMVSRPSFEDTRHISLMQCWTT